MRLIQPCSMSIAFLRATTILAGTLTTFSAFAADDTESELRQLREQLSALDQKIRVLERQREVEHEVAAEKSKSQPVTTIDDKGFTIRSADTNFTMRIHGVFQGDARFYFDHAAGAANDTFLARRVRPIFDGTIYRWFDYRLMLDFGSGLTSTAANVGFVQDAYVQANIDPAFQVRVGKDKVPVSLERLQSDIDLGLPERGFPSAIAPNRDVGIQFRGEPWSGKFEYQLGVFNGLSDGGSGDFETTDSGKDAVARVFLHPFRASHSQWINGIGFGVGGSYGDQRGALRSYASTGQQTIFGYLNGSGATATTPQVTAGGEHWRIEPQAWYYWGPLGILGEYIISDQKLRRSAGSSVLQTRADNRGWQVQGSWFLTGEDNSFRTVSPLHPFTLSEGGWGAFQAVARINQLTVDDRLFPLFANSDSSVSKATEWSVGLNWYLNRLVRLSADYSQTHYQGGGKNPATAQDEKAFISRVQLSF